MQVPPLNLPAASGAKAVEVLASYDAWHLDIVFKTKAPWGRITPLPQILDEKQITLGKILRDSLMRKMKLLYLLLCIC